MRRRLIRGFGVALGGAGLVACAGQAAAPSAPGSEASAGAAAVGAASAPPPATSAEPVPLDYEHLSPSDASDADHHRATRECDSGEPPRRWQACTWLGAAHLARGELASARARFDTACEAEHALACVGLGAVWMRGGPIVTAEGLPRDPARAVAAWQRACTLGEAAGCQLASEAHGGAD